MLRSVTRLGASRLAAVAVALALSGVGRVAAASVDRAGRHECTCAKGAHACECARCRDEQRLRAAAADASTPRCHRAAAAKALEASREARGERSSAPCLRGTCGGGTFVDFVAPAAESFFAPTGTALPFTAAITDVAESPAQGFDRPACPQAPPPRP